MTPYLIVLTVATVLALLSSSYLLQKGGKVGSAPLDGGSIRAFSPLNIFDLLMITILVAFMGLRSINVGTDTVVYAQLFEMADPRDWAWTIETIPQEVGFTAVSLVVKSFSTSPTTFLLVCAALIAVPIVVVLRRKSEIYALSVFLYIAWAFYLSPFNLMRQGVALAIVFVADYFYPRNKWLFVILIVLGTLIHASVVVFVLFYLLAKLLKPSLGLLVGVLAIAFTVLMTTSFGSLVQDAAGMFNERYSGYLETNTTGMGTILVLIFNVGLCVYLVFLARGKEFDSTYLVLLILSLFFSVLGIEYKFLVRIELYLSVFSILLVPQLVAQSNRKGLHIFGLGVAGISYMVLYLLNYGELLPYEWVL